MCGRTDYKLKMYALIEDQSHTTITSYDKLLHKGIKLKYVAVT